MDDMNIGKARTSHLEVLPGRGHGEALDHGTVGAALGAEVGGHGGRGSPPKGPPAKIIPVSRRSTRVTITTAVPGSTKHQNPATQQWQVFHWSLLRSQV